MSLYISPAIASAVRICIDEYKDCDWKGRMYTRLNTEAIPFQNIYEVLNLMTVFWNAIKFPQASTISRTFTGSQKIQEEQIAAFDVVYPEDGTRDKIKVELSETDMEKKQGEQGTFIVKIRYRQNATWQGHVTWVEENKTVPFRSALELIKLIDSTQEKDVNDWEKEN